MELIKYITIDQALSSNNIAELLDPDDVQKIGQLVVKEYNTDKSSRNQWEQEYKSAMELTQQLIEEKTFPWPGASNVKFPLITIAAMQYHSRAYPALVKGQRPVQCRVIGQDPEGKKFQRAQRVSGHMSFQVMEEDTQWEESMDKALLVQCILGCAFKKTYHDSAEKKNVSELVLPSDLVLNYWTKTMEKAPRATHYLTMSRDDVTERVRRGLWLNHEVINTQPNQRMLDESANVIAGTFPSSADEDTPMVILEQHRYLDLDGDGYREPYICWVEENTQKLYRIVARYEKDRVERNKNNEIVCIKAESFFTKFPFIPSPDGSIYDLGFGKLLGATNASIDTIINQLIDAGTMSNLGGGFFARGIRVRGGNYQFRPGEWTRTDSSSEDMKNGIVPLPVREPSATLFQLLQLLIDFGSRIAMATDPMTGVNPGQNQKATTTEAVIEQGEKVFNSIYKRTYRSLKDEFRKLYRLNYLNPPYAGKFDYTGSQGGDIALWEDYMDSDKSIVPAADPEISSREAVLKRDMNVLALLRQTPGSNIYAATVRVLEGMDVPGIDILLPKPGTPGAPPPPIPEKVRVQLIKAEENKLKVQAKLEEAKQKIMAGQKETDARILVLQAQAQKLMAETGSVEAKRMTDLIELEIEAAKTHAQNMKAMMDGMNSMNKEESDGQGTMDSMGEAGRDSGISAVSQGSGA